MSLLRQLLRLLPLLAAFLVVPAQPFGARVAMQGASSVVSHGQTAPHLEDYVTRKNRRAAGLEEYFAIDDDPDQYARLIPPVFRVSSYEPIGDEPGVRSDYRAPRADRHGRAHPSTGPPQA